MKLFFLFLCVNLISPSFGQSVSGTIINLENVSVPKVYLSRFQDGVPLLFDSCSVSNSKYLLTKNISQKGIYRLQFSGFHQVDLILSPQTSPLQFNADLKGLRSKKNLSVNKENEALFEFDQLFNSHKIKVLMHSKMRNQIINKRLTDTASIGSLKRDMVTIIHGTKKEIDRIQADYKGTYVSDILCPLLVEPDVSNIPIDESYVEAERVKLQTGFFDSWSFNDKSILANPYIIEQIFAFISKWSKQGEEGAKQAIDIYMSKVQSSSDNEVRDFFTNHLAKTFMQIGPAEVLIYFADRYLEGCSDMPAISMMKGNLAEMKSVVVGQHYLNVQLPDSSGKTAELSSSLGAKGTLVLFWSSTCSHCMQEMPKYIAMYNFYKEKGFEIYGVSLDVNIDNWKKTFKQHKMTWTNVCDGKGYQSPGVKPYFVFQTPTVVLIDQNGIIVAKNKTAEELNYLIANLLR